MDRDVRSPVTGGAATLCDTFRCADLVDRYRNDWGLEVAGHFKEMHQLPLYRCEDTGYRFFHPANLAGEASFYDQFWALENPTIHRPKNAWRDDWQFAIERIRPGEKVVDIGCADGAFIERARHVADVVGIDENQEGCRVARAAGLNVVCTTVAKFAAAHGEAFDVAAASQVLEHVYHVANFFDSMAELLKPGGRLILSVPNNQPYYAGWSKYEPLNNPPHHVGLWNAHSLRAAARHFGFDVEEITFLGTADRFALQVYRRAAHLADVTKAPNQLRTDDWIRVGLKTPPALWTVLNERRSRSTCNYAYVAAVLRKMS